MNTDSPNTGAKIQYDLVFSEGQLSTIIRLLSQLAKKYSWNMNITDSIRWSLNYGLTSSYGIKYWCHLDPIKKSIMFSSRNITKNSCIGTVSSPPFLALCAELYIVNGCNSNELVRYDLGTDKELVPELNEQNNFVYNNYVLEAYRKVLSYKTTISNVFSKIDHSIEYLYATTNTETILNFLGFTGMKARTEGVLAKKAYIEELLGCNFEDFCKLVPGETLNTENVYKKFIPDSYFGSKISIGGYVFSKEVFKQHTDMDTNLFISMLKKVNHSIFIPKNCNGILQLNNGAWNYCKYTGPTTDEMHEATINRAIAYTINSVNIQQDKVEIKSYSILKEGLTIKIEENEKFN